MLARGKGENTRPQAACRAHCTRWQVPRYHLRAKPWAPSAAFLYTGANESVASGIASGLFEQVPTVAELTQRLPDVSAYLQKGNETVRLGCRWAGGGCLGLWASS